MHNIHNQSNYEETKKLTEKIKTIEKQVKSLNAEIFQLKDIVKIKDSELKDNSIELSKMKKQMKLLECKNENLKQKIQEEKTENNKLKTLLTTKDERIDILDKTILDSKSDKIVNEVELSKNCSESNLQASKKEEKKTSSCDKCDFTYSNQFDLLIHKSANHPSYILNSQPEA